MRQDKHIHGARWWKFDFHTHTPASYDFRNKEVSPEDWLKAVMEAKIDCVAVTDHNTGAWIDQLKRALSKIENNPQPPEWYRPLIIFPGVEISVSNIDESVHLLAILDPDSTSETVTRLLAKCDVNTENQQPSMIVTHKSIQDIVEIIHGSDYNGIAVPAHIEKVKGILARTKTKDEGPDNQNLTLKGLTPSINELLGKIFVAEFCDPTFPEKIYNDALRKKVRELSIVQGSDSHSCEGFSDSRFSWIKMFDPSIETLRSALRDAKYSIKNSIGDPNSTPNVYIEKLTIRKMKHCARHAPLDIFFSPHFSAIIGGRGSGKSTIIESLRVATQHDKDLDQTAPSLATQVKKFKTISNTEGVMEKNSEIKVTVSIDGVKYDISWLAGEDRIQLFQAGNNKPESPDGVVDAARLFPINIYSQHQILSLAEEPYALLALIDNAVQPGSTHEKIENLEKEASKIRADIRELKASTAYLATWEAQLILLDGKISLYKNSGFNNVLQEDQRYSQQGQVLQSFLNFDEAKEILQNAQNSLEAGALSADEFPSESDETKELLNILNPTVLALDAIKEEIAKLIIKIDQVESGAQNTLDASAWKSNQQNNAKELERLMSEFSQKENGFNPDNYKTWLIDHDKLKKKIVSAKGDIDLLSSQENSANKLYAEHKDARIAVTNARKDFIRTTLNGNTSIRLIVVPFGNKTKLESSFRETIGLHGERFSKDIFDQDRETSLLYDLMMAEPASHPHEIDKQISRIEKLRERVFKILNGEDPDVGDVRFQSFLQSKWKESPEILDRLQTWWPDDHLIVQFKRDNTHVDIIHGSAGQKASAILAFLLSYGKNPLIIDQPEDDLDNALISELIVTQIRENKHKRQIILATHNPNIVVNGDAEMIDVMEFEDNEIKLSVGGGIDDEIVRNQVCLIMEGGAAAFRRRYDRLNFDSNLKDS